MKSTSMRLPDETHEQLEQAVAMTGLSKTAFVTMAVTTVLRSMERISPATAWIPPPPVEVDAGDPRDKGVLPSDSPEIRSLIRDSNALVLVRDGELMRDAAMRKQELLTQVLEMRRQSAEQEVVS